MTGDALKIEHHASLSSTSDRARELVEAAQELDEVAWVVVTADEQTAGRGQRGHTWHTVPERSLAMSVVVPAPVLDRPSRLTLLAAVAAARALEDCGSPPILIKWPNDLMRDDHKIGGLLAEGARTGGGQEVFVLGLGVNLALRPGDLPATLANRASDAGLDASPATRERCARGVVCGLRQVLDDLGTPQDAHNGEEYRRRSWLSGRSVSLLWGGREQRVTIQDVTADGDLCLADGRVARGEHVRVVPDDPAV